MIREILNGDFMDCRKVIQNCTSRGISKSVIKESKRAENIRTVEVSNDDGEKLWLWFDPQQIWEKYHEREAN